MLTKSVLVFKFKHCLDLIGICILWLPLGILDETSWGDLYCWLDEIHFKVKICDMDDLFSSSLTSRGLKSVSLSSFGVWLINRLHVLYKDLSFGFLKTVRKRVWRREHERIEPHIPIFHTFVVRSATRRIRENILSLSCQNSLLCEWDLSALEF